MTEEQLKADFDEHVALIAKQDKEFLRLARWRAWCEGEKGLAARRAAQEARAD